MVGLIVSAGILGIIIAVMEKDEFPGWGTMILCVLAAAVPDYLLGLVLPPPLFFVGTVVGALCAAGAIAYLTGMTPKRAAIAACIYFAVQLALGFALRFAFRV